MLQRLPKGLYSSRTVITFPAVANSFSLLQLSTPIGAQESLKLLKFRTTSNFLFAFTSFVWKMLRLYPRRRPNLTVDCAAQYLHVYLQALPSCDAALSTAALRERSGRCRLSQCPMRRYKNQPKVANKRQFFFHVLS